MDRIENALILFFFFPDTVALRGAVKVEMCFSITIEFSGWEI